MGSAPTVFIDPPVTDMLKTIDFLLKLIQRPIYISFNGVSPGSVIGMIAAVASAIAAGFAAYATYRQGLLQKHGLKQDLFDSRFKVYLAVRGFLSDFMGANEDPDNLQSKAITLLRETREAEWLFGPEVQAFIEKRLYSPVIEYSAQAVGVGCYPARP